ncbi:fructan 6-exohydrolase-like [Selaginella moellendorffii]|uniref:fructan 6-exohydrolase-like n=1 Tax=Selaginella moellendorffii TaxID=88036 RepID=UPI000D1CC0CD|nr:fructan 6-exohydrolase-like [Selaginella moellendorffii]|eukprot:XP_024532029.1 fructan 6-exohydrolase-like [Selaginella moellendorffii]
MALGFHFQAPPNSSIWMISPNAPVFYLPRILPSLLPIHHSIVIHEQEPELLGPRHRQGPPPLDASPHGAGSRAREGPVILYTGISSDGATTQNAAVPVDPGDSMLKHWKKIAQNPLIPAGGRVAMRDPSSAWRDSSWRILLGGENASDGVGFVYWSNDFLDGEWKRLETPLLRMPGAGILESPDFFQVPSAGFASRCF